MGEANFFKPGVVHALDLFWRFFFLGGGEMLNFVKAQFALPKEMRKILNFKMIFNPYLLFYSTNLNISVHFAFF